MDLAANPSASIAISLAQQGRSKCKMDVEDPTCWKLSMSGKVVPVSKEKEDFAKKALFSKCVLLTMTRQPVFNISMLTFIWTL